MRACTEIQAKGTRQSEYVGYGYTDSPFFSVTAFQIFWTLHKHHSCIKLFCARWKNWSDHSRYVDSAGHNIPITS